MTSREQYERLAAAYVAGHKAGDAEAIARLYTEDAIVLSPGGPPVQGRQAIQAEYGYVSGGVNNTQEILEFHDGGSFAYAIGMFRGDGESGNYLEILERQSDGSYRYKRMCWNSH